MSRNNLFDSLDREILYRLSLGVKLKELTKYIPLSLPGIERRKRRIAEVFDLESGSIKPILKKAKENGLV
ncbi:hypothetical protein [Maribacter sp.]|uniref:hypothetical protein n=1 Tax=Maribacter sp. TaxID=1897614 RepID=UPI0025C12722|nr:hypothetical protein [Maribacter sp.]